MDIRHCLIFALLSLAIVAEPLLHTDTQWDLTHMSLEGSMSAPETCNEFLGECIEVEDEMIDLEIVRRTLAQRRRYISYGALKKNNVPCNRRGHSYYNCARSGKANPYRRGCSVITHCARITSWMAKKRIIRKDERTRKFVLIRTVHLYIIIASRNAC